jgi:hypothetical protein
MLPELITLVNDPIKKYNKWRPGIDTKGIITITIIVITYEAINDRTALYCVKIGALAKDPIILPTPLDTYIDAISVAL